MFGDDEVDEEDNVSFVGHVFLVLDKLPLGTPDSAILAKVSALLLDDMIIDPVIDTVTNAVQISRIFVDFV